jgi:chromate transporter
MNDSHSSVLLSLLGHFTLLSFLAIGGANATIPEMHRLAVDAQGWMSDRQFGDIFAISQIAPGPNVLIVTLIGFQTAGIIGAIIATLAMCGPAAIMTCYVSRYWDRARDAPWRSIVMKAVVPISIGLVSASAYLLALTIDRSWQTALITVATAIIGFRAKFNPLWMLLGGALLGLAGLV